MPLAPADYRGHPDVFNITAITARIAITRVSGAEPLAVQAHAAGTTATFSDAGAAFATAAARAFVPYLDLHYEWDFGDASGTETFTHPVTGATVNANTDQVGPNAAYVYRTPGTYTVTLTAKAWNGTAYVTATTTSCKVEHLQLVALRGTALATGGTYTLSFGGNTTAAIAFNARCDQVKDALCLLASIGTGNVEVYGGIQPSNGKNFFLFFTGTLSGVDQALITGNVTGLTGGTAVALEVRTSYAGATAAVVTCSAFAGTTEYFDSNYVDVPADGTLGSITRPKSTHAQLRTFITGGANRRAMLKRGSAWTATVSCKFNSTVTQGLRVVAYGTGARPKITTTNANIFLFDSEYGSTADVVDYTFDGLELCRTEDVDGILSLHADTGNKAFAHGIVRNVHFLDIKLLGNMHFNANGVDCLIWRIDRQDPPGIHNADPILGGQKRYFGIFGGTFLGGGVSKVYNHQVYPIVHSVSLYRWIDFQTSWNANYCLDLNCNLFSSGGPALSPYHLVEGNSFKGTHNGVDASNSNNASADAVFDMLIAQNNEFLTTDVANPVENPQGYGILGFNTERVIVRDNTFHDLLNYAISFQSSRTIQNVYRNTFTNCGGSMRISHGINEVNGYIHLNTFTKSGTKIVEARIGTTNLATFKVDRNTYNAPGQTVPFLNQTTGAAMTFAEWQTAGLDVNGSFNEAIIPAATSYTASISPSTLAVGQPGTITIVLNGAFTGTITPAATGGGTFEPAVFTYPGTSGPQAGTYTPATEGDKTISFTNSAALTNPADLAVTTITPLLLKPLPKVIVDGNTYEILIQGNGIMVLKKVPLPLVREQCRGSKRRR